MEVAYSAQEAQEALGFNDGYMVAVINKLKIKTFDTGDGVEHIFERDVKRMAMESEASKGAHFIYLAKGVDFVKVGLSKEPMKRISRLRSEFDGDNLEMAFYGEIADKSVSPKVVEAMIHYQLSEFGVPKKKSDGTSSRECFSYDCLPALFKTFDKYLLINRGK